MAEETPKTEHFSLYTIFPTSLFFRHDISESQKMLYGLLSCMADNRGYAYPRNATLQRYLGGVSEDTVSRRLKALEAAGAIAIDGGEGGRGVRKIRIVGVDFSNLRNSAEVEGANLRKIAEVHSICNNNINNTKNNKKARAKALATEEEINGWISRWAVNLNWEREATTALIADFFAFAESRKAKGKPFLTIRAVSMQAHKLERNMPEGAGPTETAARMRYMLRSAVTHNWEEVYPIDARTEPDFWLWAGQEYGLSPAPADAPEYF